MGRADRLTGFVGFVALVGTLAVAGRVTVECYGFRLSARGTLTAMPIQ